ncbi:nucleoside transport protein 1 [Solidesulfovibrio carbinoliphilus subsp. oakridgensis]|uniref:Nucleoside transport protein 1 n=1 Tax=Solidesulfovibrio carbinoliphilus subsp. oakridgensis TaxID=694327 RepID=G7QBY0_9BACT|nr:hypothetical protein [Solidesulfovibrio carbinoliphilus]EHJ49473.1 nucleoside transport protein 1 [Solidesulfovibrio carbinoliphilus subsp. oakridgensis]
MSNGVFLLLLIVFGFVILAYFNRRAKNYTERHAARKGAPSKDGAGKDNPIDYWLTGRRDKDDDL